MSFCNGFDNRSLVVIGKCADVSIGATVLEKRKIGNFAMAGARSLVTHDIPDSEIHVGLPGKILEKNYGRLIQ